MLDGIKRLFSGAEPSSAADWEGIVPWAEAKQYGFRAVQNEGFVVDGRLSTTSWRLEWGPSLRPYIHGQELRIRAELGMPSELQVVAMNRELSEAMETAVFEQYVEGVQTRIDNQTPPEMRWLVMFPKLPGAEMGPLREHFIALSSVKPWLQQWLQGALTDALVARAPDPATPLVLMIGRGRLMLRTALATPELPALKAWLVLFEAAMREARRVANDSPDSISPSTQPSQWQASALPGDERKS